jgi:heat shock protein HslJ
MRDRGSSTVWVALCAVALSLGYPEGRGLAAESETRGTAKEPPPTIQELKNATYMRFDLGPVTLVDGWWHGEPPVKGSASGPTVHLLGDFRLVGDLEGDGREEAVVLLGESGGGSGTYVYLAVVDRVHGELRNIATRRIGDRVQIRSGRIENGRIFLDLVQPGPKDPACCPGELVTRSWVLRPGGEVEEIGTTVRPARLSLETLEGGEWILRAWSADEPAPAAPEVTLSFHAGQFVGFAGCNRYFAAAREGRVPGAVSIGPVGSTKMACPEPAMAVENRFLAQLGRVKRFGLLAGQLALLYDAGGTSSVMLFDRSPKGPA